VSCELMQTMLVCLSVCGFSSLHNPSVDVHFSSVQFSLFGLDETSYLLPLAAY